MEVTHRIPKLVETITFANYLPLLSKATSDSSEPTPGYLLNEIEKLSYDYPHHCKQIVNFLLRRLDKPSTYIKIKVLKILDHLILNGHVNLRAAMRKNDSAIKSAMKCSGVPDPLTGMVVYEQIRKMAKDLLDSLYLTERIQQDDELLMNSRDVRPIKPFLGALGSSMSTDSKYQGFGNSPNAKEETVVEKVWSYIDKLSTPSDQASKIIKEAIESSVGEYEAVRIPPQLMQFQNMEGTRHLMMPNLPMPSKVTVKSHVPGRAGGGWEDSDEEHENEVDLALSEHRSLASIELMDESHSKDSLEERNAITKFAESGAFPVSWKDISDTCAECLKLSMTDVLTTLEEELSNQSESKSMRLMVVLEALLQTEVFTSQRSIEQALAIVGPKLRAIIGSVDSPERVVIKAKKILIVLNSHAVPS
ncbi:AP-4 complex accessory subunit tepsin-like [Neocloeon triangulifer]|uniref:AP-4 complex accessory subunit tepsin-like n=1 Tax=Neocloeon triangulifer TaxID=2078957 RepID=UPI00286F09B7|nr:AP-4 complex accessory subunit tepsin-like [Neocloeon triangulifer]